MAKRELIEFNGKLATVSDHCKDLGIDRNVVYARKRITKESYSECLKYYQENEVKQHEYQLNFNGKVANIREHCNDLGLDYKIVRDRKSRTKESYEDIFNYYLENGIKKLERIELNGSMITAKQYCDINNYNYTAVLYYRLKCNISWKEAIEEYLNSLQKRTPKDNRLYNKWNNMMSRCYNPKNRNYRFYGGRKPKPIEVCERWHNYFNFEDDVYESFIAHVEEYGIKNTTIDRYPNKEGNYELCNIRWTDMKHQANNVRNNLIVEDGLTFSEFCNKYNLDYALAYSRYKLGWSLERIITTPRHPCKRKNSD